MSDTSQGPSSVSRGPIPYEPRPESLADTRNPLVEHRNTSATFPDTRNQPANPASVPEESFQTGSATVPVVPGESRKDLTKYRESVGNYRTSLKDKPEGYVGKRRAGGQDTETTPVVYLAVELVEGLGDSVIGASMDYGRAVVIAQKFAALIGEDVFPDNYAAHTLAGQRLRFADGRLSPYKIFPVILDA